MVIMCPPVAGSCEGKTGSIRVGMIQVNYSNQVIVINNNYRKDVINIIFYIQYKPSYQTNVRDSVFQVAGFSGWLSVNLENILFSVKSEVKYHTLVQLFLFSPFSILCFSVNTVCLTLAGTFIMEDN